MGIGGQGPVAGYQVREEERLYIIRPEEDATVPDLEVIIEELRQLDEPEKYQVYDFIRWRRFEQKRRRDSDGKRKRTAEARQEEWRQAIQYIDLLLAVDEAEPMVIEGVINRLQDLVDKRRGKTDKEGK